MTSLHKHVPDMPFYFPTSAPGVSFNVRVGAPFGSPPVSKACTISGETDANGEPLTTIEGGYALFSLTAETPDVTLTLKDIVFNNAYTHVAGSQPQHLGNTVIENCVIKNLKHAVDLKYTWTVGFWSFQRGGFFTAKNCLSDIPGEAPPWTTESSPSSGGLAVVGISLPYNLPITRMAKVNITDNTIKINSSQYAYQNAPPPTTGLSVLTGINIMANEGETNILNNTLFCRPVGITLQKTKNAKIAGNTISFPLSVNPPAADLPDGIVPDYTKNYAIRLMASSDNTFAGNNAAGFLATSPAVNIASQVYLLGASGNRFYGNTFGPARTTQVYMDSGSQGCYFGPNDPLVTPSQFYDSALGFAPGNAFGSTEMFGIVDEGSGSYFIKNVFGTSVDETVPCVWATGSGNKFAGNDFTGTGLKGFLYQVSTDEWIRAGDILFDEGSFNNVAEVNSGDFTPGDRCSQVADLTYDVVLAEGDNTITYEDFGCSADKAAHLAHMLYQSRKHEDLKSRIEAMHTFKEHMDLDMVSLGYVWDEELQNWICPTGKHLDEGGYCVAD